MRQGVCGMYCQLRMQVLLSVAGITVLCHFCKNDLMPVIICKNGKHLVRRLQCNIFK